MKTIEFESRKYEVEDWVNWVARDADGSIWAYENKPRQLTDDWYDEGKKTMLCMSWQKSLTKV